MSTDAERLESLRAEGLRGEQWLRHHFTFFFNRTGALAACDELTRLGFRGVIGDEEVTGDDYWHVAAFRIEALREDCLAASRTQLEELAQRLGGNYTGWDVARRGDGSLPDPAKPLSQMLEPRKPHRNS